MINRFQKTAHCVLETSIYLALNPVVIGAMHRLSNIQAVQVIEHYEKGFMPQDKNLVPAIQFLIENETKFLAAFPCSRIIAAIKEHRPIPFIEWIKIKEDLFRAKSDFSDLLQERTGYQSKFLVNFMSREKDSSISGLLESDLTNIKKMSVTIQDGKITQNGGPLSTSGYRFKGEPNEAGFVITPTGEFYLFNHLGEAPCPVTGKVILHSVFTNGAVLFAGSIKIVDGNITYISDCSGHYTPAFNIAFVNWLHEKRLLSPVIKWYDYNVKIAFNTLALSVLDNPAIIRKIKYLKGYKSHLTHLLSMLSDKARHSIITSRLTTTMNTSDKFHEYYTFAKLMDDVLPDQSLFSRHVDLLKRSFFEHLNLWLLRFGLPTKDIIGSKADLYCRSIPNISEDVSLALRGLVVQPNMDVDEVFGLRSFAENVLELSVPKRRQLIADRALIFSSVNQSRENRQQM
ncbi:MAG: hypothetical protein VXW87_05110 [Pseudomonadota bacterium]|nr:hypothetical protein [Pseudomonadota bacterium]